MDTSRDKRNIPQFNGTKYNSWKHRVRNLLFELDVLKVVDEEPPSPVTTEWSKGERIAKCTIVQYLADTHLKYDTPGSTAKSILADLDAVYENQSTATELSIRKRLLREKMGSDTKLKEHFETFDELINELSAAGVTPRENEVISILLSSLPEAYETVSTVIETMMSETNITLDIVKKKLFDYETKIRSKKMDTSAKVLQVETVETENSKRRHFRNSRFKGGSHRSQNRRGTEFKQNRHSFIGKCHQCGRKGHKMKECYYYKKRQQFKAEQRNKNLHTVQTTRKATDEHISGYAFMTGEYQVIRENKLVFLLDSGASDHLVNDDSVFSSAVDLHPHIKISIAKNGEFIAATKKGQIHVTSNLGISGVLEDVLYCPDVPYNLLSVRKMQEKGMSIIFDENGVVITKNGKTVMSGKPSNNLISIEFDIAKRVNLINTQVSNDKNNNYELWHKRLGHIGKTKFLQLKNKHMLNDMTHLEKVIPDDQLCEACIYGKQARLPFEKEKDKSHITRSLFMVHTDVCGPITPSTVNNKNYFVTFIDEYTHYSVTYLLEHKSDVFSVFKDYVAKSEARFNLKLVNLYCDNGREYLSNEMRDYCVQKGISYHLTVPRTPQLNGVAERMNRTITEKARAMINSAGLEKEFWGEAVLTATYLINLTPTRALMVDKTPFELWHNKRPSLKYLKVFGSTVYVHNKIRKSKFDEKSYKAILVGFVPNGYKIWNVEYGKFEIVRDVIVDEINYLKSRPILKEVNSKRDSRETDASSMMPKSVEMRGEINKSDNEKSDGCKRRKSDENKSDMVESREKVIVDSMKDNSVTETDIAGLPNPKDSEIEKSKDSIGPRRSDRIKQRSPISYNETEIDNDYLLVAQSIVYSIPTSFDEIKTRDDKAKWEQAIADEINSLITNKTWNLVSKPKDKNIVDCKWVFAVKNDEFGNPIKYKARLVARGFSQKYLIDYNETFAPVARISSFRFLIAFANQYGLLVHHMDVKTAFLNGVLKEEIYMRVPEGVKSNTNQVCKLNKALYGLKQSARCWFEMFDKALVEKGFRNSLVDRCIYILDKQNISENIYVVLYVDDLVIVTAGIEKMKAFKSYLMNKFCMTDLNEIKLFLGIKVERINGKITLDQSSYIKTILQRFNMQDCKPVSTPLPTVLDHLALNSDEKYDAPCRNLIGCLMYIMVCTRPDLSIAVNILSRYSNKNNKELWQNLKRVLRYLKGSADIKLTYTKTDYKNILSGYVDSDWGGSEQTDRKSTTGYLFKLYERCTISWNTKRQASVAASSTEAEYMALFEAVKEALWIKSLAFSINIHISDPVVIYEDNMGCINIANNPGNHKRSKHIDIKYHFSREQVEKGVIKLEFIPTGNQVADTLTKPLPVAKFLEFRVGLGLK